jgi:hypothetical protein
VADAPVRARGGRSVANESHGRYSYAGLPGTARISARICGSRGQRLRTGTETGKARRKGGEGVRERRTYIGHVRKPEHEADGVEHVALPRPVEAGDCVEGRVLLT